MTNDPVDHEARAVAHMAKQIRDEEDERALEELLMAELINVAAQVDADAKAMVELDRLAAREPENFATKMTRAGAQPTRVDSILMSEASYRDIVHLGIANGVADEERAKMAAGANPHSMGAMVEDTPCPDCEPREHPEALLMVGHREGMSTSTALAASFEANYGPKLDMRALRAAAQALHDASVPLDEAKQRMMDAMEKLTPADIPVVQRELQKMLVKNGPARPVNRAQRRQVKKARRRA